MLPSLPSSTQVFLSWVSNTSKLNTETFFTIFHELKLTYLAFPEASPKTNSNTSYHFPSLSIYLKTFFRFLAAKMLSGVLFFQRTLQLEGLAKVASPAVMLSGERSPFPPQNTQPEQL